MKSNIYKLLLMSACVVFMCAEDAYSQLIVNGDFESWGGTPLAPTGWTVEGSGVSQTSGIDGSTYAALIQQIGDGTALRQNTSVQPTHFTLSFDFASTDPELGRSFSLLLYQNPTSASTAVLNLRMIRGSSSGVLSLQAYSGTGWVTLVGDAFNASVYDAGSKTFTTLNAYSIQFDVNYDTGTYSLAYGPVGGSTITVSDLDAFAIAPVAGQGISTLRFQGSSGGNAYYAIDNVSVASVPESSSIGTILGVSVLLMVLCKRRERKSA